MSKRPSSTLENCLDGVRFNESEKIYFDNLVSENNNNINVQILQEFFNNIDIRYLCTDKNKNSLKNICKTYKKKL